jgi:hypothetical protein
MGSVLNKYKLCFRNPRGFIHLFAQDLPAYFFIVKNYPPLSDHLRDHIKARINTHESKDTQIFPLLSGLFTI